MLATCVASPDKPFLGRKTEHGRAVYVTGEDPRNEVHNRQDRITTALGLTKEDVADSLVLKSVTNEDIFLFSNGKPRLLAAKFVMWLEGLGRLRLVCIDSAALVYNDTEIDRRVVTAFLRFLNRMAERLKCTVILLTHPSRTSDGSVERMSSGSTAWSFGSRFGLLMQNDDGAVSVAALKGNYMAPGLKIDLEWRDGVLLDKGADGIVENIQRNADDKAVLDAIEKRWNGAGDPLSKSSRAEGRHLPRLPGGHAWLEGGPRSAAAMQRLLDAQKIEMAEYDKRRKLYGLEAPSEEAFSHEKKYGKTAGEKQKTAAGVKP